MYNYLHFIEKETEAQRNNLPTIMSAFFFSVFFVSSHLPFFQPFLEGEIGIYLPSSYSLIQ